MMGNLKMGQETEKESSIMMIIKVNYYLKGNIKMEKNGMEKLRNIY